jgi:hypothetical protein
LKPKYTEQMRLRVRKTTPANHAENDRDDDAQKRHFRWQK